MILRGGLTFNRLEMFQKRGAWQKTGAEKIQGGGLRHSMKLCPLS